MSRNVRVYPGLDGRPLHGVEKIAGKGSRYITYCGMLCPRHWVPRKSDVLPVIGLELACPACDRALIESEARAREDERRMYEKRA